MNTVSCKSSASARYLPFAIFMVFIGLAEGLRSLAGEGGFTLTETSLYYLYPVKILIVAYLLYRYRSMYSEILLRDLVNLPQMLAACGTGLLVFVLWINMDWPLMASGNYQGFNPTLLPGNELQLIMTLFRVSGAVLVVPLMEELFWRSFLIRYIIDHDFEMVPIGTFTWVSFIITVVMFGLEHHFVLAGMAAGIVYNLFLYRTKSLALCVVAHAITNLALAVYIIFTGKWYFW